ncbi:MAG: asparaginase [Acidobacteriota bacterium]|nr:asparaginase [Acidobacteriota bacterium]
MRDAPLPVVARVLRGGRIESQHRGAVAAVDAEGRLLAFQGDPELPVFLRSTAKPFQAMPLLVAGGERAFRLGDDEIALLCASHGGEPRHLRVARKILARGGFRVSDLECGADFPMDPASARALLRRGERPSGLHNNCSGQHAGLLLACRLLGFPSRGYTDPGHPLQAEILRRVAAETSTAESEIGIAVDGCNIPVFQLPLSGLARGFARLAQSSRGTQAPREAGEGSAADPASEIRSRIWNAMCASPAMVAGRGRFTTDLIDAGRGAWIGKEGTEAIYAMALRSRTGEKAIGVAFKIEDGSTRSRDAVALRILEALAPIGPSARKKLAPHRRPPVRTASGKLVGEIISEVVLQVPAPPRPHRGSAAGARE